MRNIIKHYGKEHQLIKCMEEMSELNHVIARRVNEHAWNKVALFEELADVYVVLEQLKIIVCDDLGLERELLDEALTDEAEYKIKRVKERMRDA